MTTYRIDLYAEPHRLTGVHLVSTRIGREAIHEAHRDIKGSGCDFAEVFMGDGTGGTLYYTTVRNEITESEDGDRLYADDVARMLLESTDSPTDRERFAAGRARLLAQINGDREVTS